MTDLDKLEDTIDVEKSNENWTVWKTGDNTDVSGDLAAELTKLVAQASEKKVITKEHKLIKSPDLNKIPDMKNKVVQLQKDGFSVEQIAAAIGFPSSQVALLLADKVEVGSPEQVLKASLETVVSLIPVADAVYRDHPSFQNSLALTGLIDSSKGLIQDLFHLQDKEDNFRAIMSKVVQPVVRTMISDMMTEFRFLMKSFDKYPESKDPMLLDLQNTALNVGKKFEEVYRRAGEQLAATLGLNPDAKARAMASLSLNDD